MSRRDRSPRPGARYYLPRNEFKYVVAFCMTYYELKIKLMETGSRSHELDGMPHGTNVGNPTESEAIKRVGIESKIKLIEDTVRDCAGDVLYKVMLSAVTEEDMTLPKLKAIYDVPMGKNQFSMLKREIYWRIAKAL